MYVWPHVIYNTYLLTIVNNWYTYIIAIRYTLHIIHIYTLYTQLFHLLPKSVTSEASKSLSKSFGEF